MSPNYKLINDLENHLYDIQNDLQSEIDDLTEFCRCPSCKGNELTKEEIHKKALLKVELLSVSVRRANIRALMDYSDVLEHFDSETLADNMSECTHDYTLRSIWNMYKNMLNTLKFESSFENCPNRDEIKKFLDVVDSKYFVMLSLLA